MKRQAITIKVYADKDGRVNLIKSKSKSGFADMEKELFKLVDKATDNWNKDF